LVRTFYHGLKILADSILQKAHLECGPDGNVMTAPLHPWACALNTLFAEAWRRLVRGVHDRRAPARHPTLATVSPQNLPQLRTVVLRAVDTEAATVRLFTDLHSSKVSDLRTTPKAALHVWDNGARLQLRLHADVRILTGAEVASLWARLSEAARRSYGGHPPPGQPIADALAFDRTPDQAAFAVLHLVVMEMDILHLGSKHRRARFTRDTAWRGHWCAP